MAAIIVSATVWGIGPIFIRFTHVTGLTTSFWRLLIAIPVMATMAKFAGTPVTREMVIKMAPCGALFGLNTCFGFTANKTTTIAASSMIGSMYPVLLVFFAWPILRERVSRRQVVLSLVVVSGVIVMVLAGRHSGHHSVVGDVYALVASLIWVVYFVKTKRIRELGYQPLAMFASVMISGAITVLPVAAIFAKDFTSFHRFGWGWILAMVFIPGAIGHGLLNWAHPFVNASLSSVLLQLSTVVSVLVGWRKFHEPMHPVQWIAVAVVVTTLCALALSHGRLPLDPEVAADHA